MKKTEIGPWGLDTREMSFCERFVLYHPLWSTFIVFCAVFVLPLSLYDMQRHWKNEAICASHGYEYYKPSYVCIIPYKEKRRFDDME